MEPEQFRNTSSSTCSSGENTVSCYSRVHGISYGSLSNKERKKQTNKQTKKRRREEGKKGRKEERKEFGPRENIF
jgi:hypothetical protein